MIHDGKVDTESINFAKVHHTTQMYPELKIYNYLT